MRDCAVTLEPTLRPPLTKVEESLAADLPTLLPFCMSRCRRPRDRIRHLICVATAAEQRGVNSIKHPATTWRALIPRRIRIHPFALGD